MRVLGMEFGYRIPVMPIGGNQRINWRKNKSLSVVFGLFVLLQGGGGEKSKSIEDKHSTGRLCTSHFQGRLIYVNSLGLCTQRKLGYTLKHTQ
jgi:hypothetical protein